MLQLAMLPSTNKPGTSLLPQGNSALGSFQVLSRLGFPVPSVLSLLFPQTAATAPWQHWGSRHPKGKEVSHWTAHKGMGCFSGLTQSVLQALGS